MNAERNVFYEKKIVKDIFFIKIYLKRKHYSQRRFRKEELNWKSKIIGDDSYITNVVGRELIDFKQYSIIIEDSFHGISYLASLTESIETPKDVNNIKKITAGIFQLLDEHPKLNQWLQIRHNLNTVPKEIKELVRPYPY